MDPERTRIRDDLRGLIKGEVRCDEVFLQLYSTDASIYQIRPLAVVMPRTTSDVAAIVQYAAEHQIPVHARGAGSGLAGESLGPGLVVDFSKHMRRVLSVSAETVRVQPGVVLERLNSVLRPRRRQFGPDPSLAHVTTMGSVVAIDAAGSHWLHHGSARRHVISLEVVLADGQVIEVGREPFPTPDDSGDGRRIVLTRRVGTLLAREADLIAARQPPSRVNRSGYNLSGVLAEGHLHLAQLLSGSEGTLALITEATLGTVLLPPHRGVLLLFFDRMEAAARAVEDVVATAPGACDLMDRRHLKLACEANADYERIIPARAEAMLLVEHEGETEDEVRAKLLEVATIAEARAAGIVGSRHSLDEAEIEFFWKLARRVVPTLYRMKGSARPVPFVEDMVVPPRALPTFLGELHRILNRHQVTASLYGHVGHGQLHVRPFMDLSLPEEVARLPALASDLYEAVFAVGGAISGEHGDGLSRTAFVKRQYGELFDVFCELKRIFDPQNILNPGKIVGSDDLALVSNLRPVPASPLVPRPPEKDDHAPPGDVVQLELEWSPVELARVVQSCNGCGSCRLQAQPQRMCPMFRFAPREEASPRAKANLMRGLLTGDLPGTAVSEDDFKEIADLCVHCHMCRMECPASVDIPKLMLEAKAAYLAANGASFREWALSRWDSLSRIGGVIRPLANWVLGNRQTRWMLEKAIGLSRYRQLPRFAPRSFLRVAARRRLTRPPKSAGRRVAYFFDTYVNFFDPALGESLIRVLEHNGIAVYVPPFQRASGMGLIAAGEVEAARRLAVHNVRLLADAVRHGFEVVTTEPSALMAMAHDYLSLLEDDDVQLVAHHAHDASEYLWQLHRESALKTDLRPISARIAYHLPCHLSALDVGPAGERLLKLIPEMSVERVEKGCSGMAGLFGLRREQFRNSLRAGRPLITALRQSAVDAGTSECTACRMQIGQGTPLPTVHPVKVLAAAYGLISPDTMWDAWFPVR
jgi:FAD/FMN-containing dehydrogenase/Fe-S oxidoreductase